MHEIYKKRPHLLTLQFSCCWFCNYILETQSFSNRSCPFVIRSLPCHHSPLFPTTFQIQYLTIYFRVDYTCYLIEYFFFHLGAQTGQQSNLLHNCSSPLFQFRQRLLPALLRLIMTCLLCFRLCVIVHLARTSTN